MTQQGKSVRESVNWGSYRMGSVLDADKISNLVFLWVGKINQFLPVAGAKAAVDSDEN